MISFSLFENLSKHDSHNLKHSINSLKHRLAKKKLDSIYLKTGWSEARFVIWEHAVDFSAQLLTVRTVVAENIIVFYYCYH